MASPHKRPRIDEADDNYKNKTDASSEYNNIDEKDKGHRLGNFHTYYKFHPPDDRLDPLYKLFDVPGTILGNPNGKDGGKKQTIFYCDLGCNEGLLTLDHAKRLALDCDSGVACLGLDVDDLLIDRATATAQKYWDAIDKDTEGKVKGAAHAQSSEFQVCNLCDATDHDEACRKYLAQWHTAPADHEDENSNGNLHEGNTCSRRFDITTLFSTTMWIHVHSGDAGLKAFLRRVCNWTNVLLVEPQPSKCYRSINVRLRKMIRPQVDMNADNLSMRANIEDKISEFVISCGFRRVDIRHETENGAVIAWNRSLMLFKRVEDV